MDTVRHINTLINTTEKQGQTLKGAFDSCIAFDNRRYISMFLLFFFIYDSNSKTRLSFCCNLTSAFLQQRSNSKKCHWQNELSRCSKHGENTSVWPYRLAVVVSPFLWLENDLAHLILEPRDLSPLRLENDLAHLILEAGRAGRRAALKLGKRDHFRVRGVERFWKLTYLFRASSLES